MTPKALINGVELTEQQLRDGLAQIDQAKRKLDGTIYSYCDAKALIVPLATLKRLVAAAETRQQSHGYFDVYGQVSAVSDVSGFTQWSQ